MPTGQDLVTRAAKRYRDENNDVLDPADWQEHIQAAYRRFYRRAKFPTRELKSDIAFVAGDESQALPDGVVSVYAAWDSTPGDTGRLTRLDSWAQALRLTPDLTEQGTPTYYLVSGGSIYPIPRPASARTITVVAQGEPEALTFDGVALTDTPNIPAAYHEAIVEGALATQYRDDNRNDLAQLSSAEFDRLVAEAIGDLIGTRHDSYPVPRDHMEEDEWW